MKIAFIVDPLDQLKAYKDTSVFIMREAVRRGHQIFTFEARHMAWTGGAVVARVCRVALLEDNHAWYRIEAESEHVLADFDCVFMRKDPPFDMEYLYATLLLELAEQQGAKIINRPRALRDYNEKLAIARFPAFTVPTLVTCDLLRLNAFIEEYQDTILKKLDGMGGTSIFRVRSDDPNRNALLEVQTRLGGETVMIQQYIPAIAQGDKRILIIDGKPAPYALARIPKAGETRGNLAAGGRGVAQPLSTRDRDIVEQIGSQLVNDGLLLVGIDVIGDYLTEVNVTSPTCMVEIFDQTGFNSAAMMLDAIEA